MTPATVHLRRWEATGGNVAGEKGPLFEPVWIKLTFTISEQDVSRTEPTNPQVYGKPAH